VGAISLIVTGAVTFTLLLHVTGAALRSPGVRRGREPGGSPVPGPYAHGVQVDVRAVVGWRTEYLLDLGMPSLAAEEPGDVLAFLRQLGGRLPQQAGPVHLGEPGDDLRVVDQVAVLAPAARSLNTVWFEQLRDRAAGVR